MKRYLAGVVSLGFLVLWNASGEAPDSAFKQAISVPASQGVRYGRSWVPPGETASLAMDCSNAVRWLYRAVAGIELPRTASSQYYELARRGRIRRVGSNPKKLAQVLQPGDLLFWEHTYRPKRKPPVTHVMVYLGRGNDGRLYMAGSQGSRGVGIYRFDPEMKMGGYRVFFFFQRPGRFVAYGRP